MSEIPSSEIPRRAEDIDAAWLETALAASFEGVRVRACELVGRSELTNSHARLRVHYDEPAGAPETFFCKLLPPDGERRRLIAQTGMGPREVRFYTHLAPHLSIRIPRPFRCAHDREDFAFVLLLEDLVETGCTISDGSVGLTPDAAAVALEDLAELHARCIPGGTLAAASQWVTGPMESDYGAVMLQVGLDQHRERLSDAFAEHAALYIEKRSALHALWHEGPQTVIHGDPHIGNLFDDGTRTGFLDWGIINRSTPLRDVSYLLVMALGIEERRTHERALLQHYLDALRAGGGFEIDFDTAFGSHRIHAAYGVPASCQIVTFPPNPTPARETFAGAFLSRAEAALEDLEVRDALRKAGV